METPYRIWRRRLHELQLKIDAFDESYDYVDYNHEQYLSARKPLIDEIEAHRALEGDAIEATESMQK